MEENICDICPESEACEVVEETLVEDYIENSDAVESEPTLPTREEYDSLIKGVFREFYEADLKGIKESLIAEAKRLSDEQKENTVKEAQRELLSKIRAKNQRISEIGIMKNHGNAKRRVSDMTKEERAAVAKRAARGEIINLK